MLLRRDLLRHRGLGRLPALAAGGLCARVCLTTTYVGTSTSTTFRSRTESSSRTSAVAPPLPLLRGLRGRSRAADSTSANLADAGRGFAVRQLLDPGSPHRRRGRRARPDPCRGGRGLGAPGNSPTPPRPPGWDRVRLPLSLPARHQKPLENLGKKGQPLLPGVPSVNERLGGCNVTSSQLLQACRSTVVYSAALVWTNTPRPTRPWRGHHRDARRRAQTVHEPAWAQEHAPTLADHRCVLRYLAATWSWKSSSARSATSTAASMATVYRTMKPLAWMAGALATLGDGADPLRGRGGPSSPRSSDCTRCGTIVESENTCIEAMQDAVVQARLQGHEPQDGADRAVQGNRQRLGQA